MRTAAVLLQYLVQHQSIVRCPFNHYISFRVHLCCEALQIARELFGGTWILQVSKVQVHMRDTAEFPYQ